MRVRIDEARNGTSATRVEFGGVRGDVALDQISYTPDPGNEPVNCDQRSGLDWLG